MIPVARVREPADFDARVRQPGNQWLQTNAQARRPRDLWSPYLSRLARGFGHRCGYAAMLDPTGGTVDHYLSFKNHPHLAYEWTNYRFVSHTLNASKRTADDTVLDPYLVRAGWFEILLPSLQMRVTARVPQRLRAKAEYTLQRLKLRDGEKIVRWRQHWYERYQKGLLTLDGLRDVAPLIAEAVERQARKATTSAHEATSGARASKGKSSGRARKATSGTQARTGKSGARARKATSGARARKRSR